VKHVAVVGASLAGLSAARALRKQGFAGTLTIIGAERHRPYDRPPLSKEFLAGAVTSADLTLEAEDENLSAEWHLGVSATRLDVEAGRVELDDGAAVVADGVVIATGARSRTLSGATPGSGVHTLRTLDDAIALRADLMPGARLVVIGAGFIGAEVAATAHGLGCQVVVLEAAPTPLSGPLGVEMGALVAGLHAGHGVTMHCGTGVSGLLGTDRVTGVALADGRVFAADAVVVGVGAEPNVSWLRDSGLDVADGVHCDQVGSTGHPRVVAVGDCAAWLEPDLGRHRRVEHWTAARDRPAIAVQTLLAGGQSNGGARTASIRERAPYFWSDQYGVRIQFAGHARPDDEVSVEVGRADQASFLAVYRREGRPVAVLGVDQVREFTRWRRQLA
jgi:NADPH-dependent 2,4-dienoyl-CoA reductase/sulfur reductase-like enzyme